MGKLRATQCRVCHPRCHSHLPLRFRTMPCPLLRLPNCIRSRCSICRISRRRPRCSRCSLSRSIMCLSPSRFGRFQSTLDLRFRVQGGWLEKPVAKHGVCVLGAQRYLILPICLLTLNCACAGCKPIHVSNSPADAASAPVHAGSPADAASAASAAGTQNHRSA